jgi:ATP-dependent DNA ligase
MMNFKLGQYLYAPTKTGNVKVWCCEVFMGINEEAPALLVISTRTKLDGKEIRREEKITQGKNLGKSNETTPYEQAMSEARSKYNKKADKGYRVEIPTDTTKANTNALGFPQPMLAKPIDKVKKVEFPAHFQVKLDGHRALVTKKDGKMIMYSRQGKLITTMGHILDFLEDKIEEGQFLDGELYLHGEALQNIGSYIKKLRPDSKKIIYWVYDIILDVPFDERLKILRKMLSAVCDLLPVCNLQRPTALLFTIDVHSLEEAMQEFQVALDDGFEGGILRTPDKGYQAGFRSRNLLKIKSFDDSEYEIVDVSEGKDRIVNGVHLKVAVFTCEMSDGKTFEVTAFGDMYQKDEIWHSRMDYIGKIVTVKHSGYTEAGKPWHPVAMRLREDI